MPTNRHPNFIEGLDWKKDLGATLIAIGKIEGEEWLACQISELARPEPNPVFDVSVVGAMNIFTRHDDVTWGVMSGRVLHYDYK